MTTPTTSSTKSRLTNGIQSSRQIGLEIIEPSHHREKESLADIRSRYRIVPHLRVGIALHQPTYYLKFSKDRWLIGRRVTGRIPNGSAPNIIAKRKTPKNPPQTLLPQRWPTLAEQSRGHRRRLTASLRRTFNNEPTSWLALSSAGMTGVPQDGYAYIAPSNQSLASHGT